MHFVNNLSVLHRRDEFVDDEAVGTYSAPGTKKRHLVRMRLRNEECGWEIPRELKKDWEDAFGERGGRVWHLEPMPEGFFPLRKYLL
jgi:hypothetical protein